MNRIFKVIWSEARNAYVVVSELTKRQSKSCSTKKLLATLIAAGVFSMAGMHAPVTAAEPKVGLVDSTHYAAIAVTDKGGNPTANPGDGFTQQTLTVYDQNGNSTGETRDYYVRNGFTVYIQKQEQVLTGSKVQELVIALVSGEAENGGYVMSSTQNIIDPLVNSNNENVTTVLGQSLNGTSLNTYIAAVNGGIDALSTWDYIIQDVNGKWVNVKDDTNTSKLVEVALEADGNYYYGNKKINKENVYFLKKGNVATPMAFLDSNGGIYTGTVRGLHNEYLMTGQDADGNIYTYWGAKADDDNTLLANSGITVGQLNKSFDTLEANEQRLADADIKSIKLDKDHKTINLIRNDIAGNSVAGGLTLGSGGGDGEDTYVTIKNTDGEIKLPSGSRVVATASADNKLTSLSINSKDYQLSKYQITEKAEDASTPANVVKTYNFNEIGSSEASVDLVDTDTTYSVEDVTDSTSGAKSAKKLVNNLGQEIGTFVDTDTDTKYTAGTGIRIDPSDNNKISIIPSEVANSVRISYKANGESAQSVSLSKGLNFVQGKNVQISTGENGVVNISATDTNTQNTTVAGKNITVSADSQENGTIKYIVKTNDEVEFNKVTVGKTTGFNGVVISGSGITMNNQQITGLAAGVADTDAVNLGQLREYAATAGANTKVLAGKNIRVESNTDGGKNEYTVNLDNNVTLGSDSDDGSLLVKSSVGNVLISNGQIIGDKYAITNDGGAIFADGVISAAGDGTFRAANGNFTVFADGTVDSKLGDDGRFLATSGGLSVTKGSSNFVVTGAGVSLSAGKNALVVNADGTAIAGGLNVLGSKITNVAAGVDDTDAVNVGQLREAVAAGDTNTHIESATKAVANDNTVAFDIVDEKKQTKVGEVKITDIAKASDLGDVSKLDADLKNQGSNVTTVVDAVNNLNDKVGDLQYLNVEKGDIKNGDNTTTAIGKLNQALQNVSLEATAHNTVSNAAGDTNITISESTNSDGGTNYALALNKQKINLGNVIIEGEKGSITAKNVTAGKTSIGDAGVQFDGKTYIGENGINANDQNITNVAAGELSETSKDAVNGSQLYATNQQVNQNTANINSLDNRISKLGSRVNKVGAGAAALAALHPMDFDPDDKLSFAVGMGNYAGQNAAAIGAFYRPNEKVMMSVGGTYGNDENMVNVGLSFALDRTNNVSNSRTAMAREIIELRSHVAKQDQQIAQLTALVNKLVGNDVVKGEGVLFPDVPENHWAYEYINGLVQAGVIDGYPDGTFGGERSLTRYEYASMLYKAMLKGTILHKDIAKEFESEIARIRVDRISGKDNDANKIERVRVNYQNRDNYGSRIAK